MRVRVPNPLVAVMIASGLCAWCGCASGPRGTVDDAVEAGDVERALHAYEQLRAVDGPGPDVLARVAALVLERAALHGDPMQRNAALHQLAIAGTRGRASLLRIVHWTDDRITYAKALEILARSGHDGATKRLRRLLDAPQHPEVLAAAISTTRPQRTAHRERLLEWLEHPASTVRAAAAIALARWAPDSEARLALAEAARVDPVARVRGAAVRALGAYGTAAMEALRNRLGDPESSVRLAAVRALVRADRGRALPIVGSLLDGPPTPASIEAARVLALTHTPGGDAVSRASQSVVTARAYLRRAVHAGPPSLRSQAAVAVASLPPDRELDRELANALEDEPDAHVQLQLVRALQRRDSDIARARARETLRKLVDHDGVVGVQAATRWAAATDAAVPRDRLRRALASHDPMVRRLAARGLARHASRPDAARAALCDARIDVRIYAAGSILAAASS